MNSTPRPTSRTLWSICSSRLFSSSLTVVILLLFPALAQAQTGTPTSWTLRIYQAGQATAQAITVTAAQVQCNQTSPTALGTENPTRWIWNDVANAGKVCIYADTRLAALADGSYEGTASASNADGSSAETARVPFTRRRPNPPAVPTGLSFTP